MNKCKYILSKVNESEMSEADRDVQRVSDILNKANGNDAKAISLAAQMAKAITTPDKAYFRYRAAIDIFGNDHEVTKIFLKRAQELKHPQVAPTVPATSPSVKSMRVQDAERVANRTIDRSMSVGESSGKSIYHVMVDGDDFEIEATSLANAVKIVKDKYPSPDRVIIDKPNKNGYTPLIDTKYGDAYGLIK